PGAKPKGDQWVPGSAPSQALRWELDSLAKAGTLAIIGVYPVSSNVFPIGELMNRNFTLKAGNCPHRKYLPKLLQMVRSGTVDPSALISQHVPFERIVDAYEAFDARSPGWVKVGLQLEAAGVTAAQPEGSVLHS